MTNADVIQTMTVKELARFLIMFCMDDKKVEYLLAHGYDEDINEWLKGDSQEDDGLLTEKATRYWKVH